MKIMRAIFLIFAMTSMLVLVGCGSSSDSEDQGKGDEVVCLGGLATNNIVSMPEANVAVSGPFAVTFACDLDEETINDSSLTVSCNGVPVVGDLSYQAATKTLLFTPRLPLASGMTYDIVISGMLLTTEAPVNESISVEKMVGDLSTSFVTMATPLIYSSTLDPVFDIPAQSNIWTMNVDGTSPLQLTSFTSTIDNAYATQNAWSPDDQHIAYVLTKNLSGTHYQFLMVMNPDGTENTPITVDGEFYYRKLFFKEGSRPLSFDWAPDGSKLYSIFKPDGVDKHDIYSINLDGSEKVRITNIPVDTADDEYLLVALRVSPDGSKLLYYLMHYDNLNNEESAAVYLINSDGTGAQDITTAFFGAKSKGIDLNSTRFSPDNRKVYISAMPYGANHNLFVYDIASGGDWQKITDLGTDDLIKDYDISLNGDLIAYSVYCGGLGTGASGICGDLTTVTSKLFTLSTETYLTRELTNATPAVEPASIGNVAVSPDGSKIAYVHISDLNMIRGGSLYMISANNTGNTKLSGDTAVSWVNAAILFSPDGSSVGYNFYYGDPKTEPSNIAIDSTKLTDSIEISSLLADWW